MPKNEFAAAATDSVGSVRIVGHRLIAKGFLPVVEGETWMRDRDTGEAVLVTEIGEWMTRYQNVDCEGEVQTALLHKQFEVLHAMPDDAEPG